MGEPGPKTTRFPRAFGKYQIQREAGRGGGGVVYEAVDTVLQRTVALKLTLTGPGADPGARVKEQERFLIEARIGAHLPKHPHIVSVYEVGDVEGKHYLASEFIQGEPLALWRKKPSVTTSQQVRILRDVALAIEHSHHHGVVHRDLKPGNILVDAASQPHVTDFGLAKMAGHSVDLARAAPGRVWGTPPYMSPEHARGLDSVDARADVYSLGAMLYEILAGHAPFHGVDPSEVLPKIVHDPVPPPSGLAKGPFPLAHKPLEALCMKALSKNPAQRPATAKEFADELSRWLGAGRSTVRRTAPEKKNHQGILAAGVAAVGVVAILVFALTRRSGAPEQPPVDPAARAAEQARRKEQEEREKQRDAELTAEKARREEAEKARQDQERKVRELEAGRKADGEETLKQQAFLLAQKREAEERTRKAEAQLKEAAAPPTPAAPPPPPPPTPSPAAPPAAPPAPKPPPPVLTGLPATLPDGTLHWEAEDYTGGDAALAGRDFQDSTPGNVGRMHRAQDVDIARNPDGTVWVGAIEPGEWLNFRFEGEGRFEVEIRYIAGQNAAAHLEVDGTNVTGSIPLPPTGPQGAWGTFKATTQRIPGGSRSLRFVFDVRVFALDWFRLKRMVPAPVPGAAPLREAEKAIRNLFKADYARRAPADLAVLSQKLLQEGVRTEGATVDKFALLSEARDVAAQAAHASQALAAVEELDKWFAVDAAALRLEALTACGRAARTSEASREIAEAYLGLAEQAAARDDLDASVTLAGKAEASARAAQEVSLVSRMQSRAKELIALRDEYRPVKTALKTLEEKPEDPAANLSVGTYRCFARNDWSRGLPMLSKGSDAALAALARKELDGAETGGRELALADSWRETGEKKSGALRGRLLTRSLYWYERAMPAATGLDRMRIEGQVESLYRVIGGDAVRKGLVFWVEPGRDTADPFRELVFGSRYTNNGAQTADAGRALSFSGSYVDYATPDAVKSVDRAGSIFVWMRNDANFASLVNRAEPDRGQNDLWLWVQNGILVLGFNFPDNARRYNSRNPTPQGRWVHCGVTWDERNVTFYIDGKEDSASPIGPNPVFPPRRTSRLRIGSYLAGGAEFRGLAGSVMIFNRALSGQEAAHLFSTGRSRLR